MPQEESKGLRILNPKGHDVFGNPSVNKKNEGIISRMKRSLSANGRSPPMPLKLTSLQALSSEWAISSQTLNEHTTEIDGFMSNSTSSPINSTFITRHSFDPGSNSTLSSPMPTSTSFFQVLPSNTTSASSTTSNNHASSSTASSSIHLARPSPNTPSSSNTYSPSYPTKLLSPSSSSLNISKATLSSSNSNSNIKQQNGLSQPRPLTDSEKSSLTKPSAIKGMDSKPPAERKPSTVPLLQFSVKGVPAPAPSMYWSCPKVYGTKPPPLRSHASTVCGSRMFVYGGANSKTNCSNTLFVFELDTFTWSAPLVYGSPPPACRAHSLLADEETGQVYFFGGGNGHDYFNHFYTLDTHTMSWTCLQPPIKGPSPRRAHCMAILQHSRSLLLFGGGDGTKALNDVHTFSLKKKEWSVIKTHGKKPMPRGYHTGTIVGDKLVVLGGSDGKECFGEIYVLDLISNRWHQMEDGEKQQIPRLAHSAICIGSFLFVIAGHDGTQYCNDLLLLNLVNMSWESRDVYGQAPTPRGYHTTVLYDSRVFMFGGYNGVDLSNEVHVLELSSYAYLPQIANFQIDTA